MQNSLKILHLSYAVSIAILFDSLMLNIAKYASLDIGTQSGLLFLGISGAFLIILGLFKFQKGLSFGLTFGGILCVGQGALPLFNKVADLNRFILALVVLIIVMYALYRLREQEKGVQK